MNRPKPDNTVEKLSKKQHEAGTDKSSGVHVCETFLHFPVMWYFSVYLSLCFLFLYPAFWWESSVFINREDTSVSVAVMHTG